MKISEHRRTWRGLAVALSPFSIHLRSELDASDGYADVLIRLYLRSVCCPCAGGGWE